MNQSRNQFKMHPGGPARPSGDSEQLAVMFANRPGRPKRTMSLVPCNAAGGMLEYTSYVKVRSRLLFISAFL